MKRLFLTITNEKKIELEEHFKMNGYSVKWEEDSVILFDEEEMSYVETILLDRDISFSQQEPYWKLKKRHRKEVSDFPMKAAFSKEQYKEMMKEWGFRENAKNKIISIGYGCFIRKSDKEAYVSMLSRHRREHQEAVSADSTGDGYIFDMFYKELCNHEFIYTREVDETLDALSLSMDMINKNPALKHGLEKAMQCF